MPLTAVSAYIQYYSAFEFIFFKFNLLLAIEWLSISSRQLGRLDTVGGGH